MALVRGRDEKDFVKDIHDRARNIIAQAKDIPRLSNTIVVNSSLGDPFIPFQYPLEKTGLNERDFQLLARRQQQRIRNQSRFFDDVSGNGDENSIRGSMFFNNKMMFS